MCLIIRFKQAYPIYCDDDYVNRQESQRLPKNNREYGIVLF